MMRSKILPLPVKWIIKWIIQEEIRGSFGDQNLLKPYQPSPILLIRKIVIVPRHLRYKTGRKTFFVCKYKKVSLLNYFSDVDRFCEIYSRQDIPDSGTRYRTSKIGVRWKHRQLYNWISSARTEMIILGVLGNEDFIHRNNKWIKLIK